MEQARWYIRHGDTRVKVFLYADDKILEITGLHRRLLSTAGGGPLISILRAVDTMRRKSGGKNGYRAGTGPCHTIAEIKVAGNGARIGAATNVVICNTGAISQPRDRSAFFFLRSRRDVVEKRHLLDNCGEERKLINRQ